MNREAKIGLFGVLVLVVLVVVMWARLAGEDRREPGPVAADPSTTSDQAMMATDTSHSDPAPADTTTDPSSYTDVLTHTYDGLLSSQKDTSSTKKEFDPYSYYDENKTSKKTKTFDDDFGTDVVDDVTGGEKAYEKKTETEPARPWGDIDTTNDKKTEEVKTTRPFTTTTTFGRFAFEQPDWPKVHVVAKGETLSDISTKYYQTSKHWRLIADDNRPMAPDPDRIWIGMKLRIPEPPPAREPKIEVAADLVPKPGSKYKVRKGDTLSEISQVAYGTATAWETILAENQHLFSAPEELAEGMIISIPARP